jgi:CheY-like chemotaxis protein
MVPVGGARTLAGRVAIHRDHARFRDGQQTLDYLLGNGSAAHRPKASSVMVLPDLNMPGMSGYQVLERLKADGRTRSIPIVVLTTTDLTTTDDSGEVKRCYDLGCNAYITKPVDYEQFSEAIHRPGLFLTIVRMPDGR